MEDLVNHDHKPERGFIARIIELSFLPLDELDHRPAAVDHHVGEVDRCEPQEANIEEQHHRDEGRRVASTVGDERPVPELALGLAHGHPKSLEQVVTNEVRDEEPVEDRETNACHEISFLTRE